MVKKDLPPILREKLEYLNEEMMDAHRVRIKEISTNDSILDVAGAIIDIVIDETHLYYPDLRSKFIEEACAESGAKESEISILYGNSYYDLEDAIVEMLTETKRSD